MSTRARLADREHHRARDVLGVQRLDLRRVVEERRVDHPRLDQRHPHAGVVEVLAGRLAHAGDGPLGRAVERALQRAAAGHRAGQQQVALASRSGPRASRGSSARRRRRSSAPSPSSAPRRPRRTRAGRRSRRWRTRRRCRPYSSSARCTSACWSSHSVTSQRTAIASRQLAGERLQLVLGAGGQHEPVAGLGGLAGGRGADAGGGAGDQEHGLSEPWLYRYPGCSLTGPGSRCAPAAAATAACRSGARRTCPRAGRTAATAAAAATWCCAATTRCATCSPSSAAPHYRADRGGHGQGAQRHGADGEPMIVRVPPGTQVTQVGRHPLRPRAPRARRSRSPSGGPGGRGNKQFVSADAPGAAAGRARACRARRAGSSCTSSCSPTSGSSGSPTRASRRCWRA